MIIYSRSKSYSLHNFFFPDNSSEQPKFCELLFHFCPFSVAFGAGQDGLYKEHTPEAIVNIRKIQYQLVRFCPGQLSTDSVSKVAVNVSKGLKESFWMTGRQTCSTSCSSAFRSYIIITSPPIIPIFNFRLNSIFVPFNKKLPS